jgi:uncharacterized protein (TIGR00251 family)
LDERLVFFMRRKIKVFAGAGRDDVSEKDGALVVRVKAPAENNKANIAVMKLLTKHFGREVRIVSGFTSKRKTIDVAD